MSKFLVSIKQLVSEVAKCGVSQSPDVIPDDLEYVLRNFHTRLTNNIAFVTAAKDEHNLGFLEIDRPALFDLLDATLKSIPEFEEWNLSHVEKERGVGVHDEDRKGWVSVSRYWDIEDKHNFIDLDALIQNVVRACEEEHSTVQDISKY